MLGEKLSHLELVRETTETIKGSGAKGKGKWSETEKVRSDILFCWRSWRSVQIRGSDVGQKQVKQLVQIRNIHTVKYKIL